MLNAAIVGLGRWGQVLVNSVQGRSEKIRFVAGATGRPERAADFAACQRIEMLPDLSALLARTDIDAVVLATPHSQHTAQIMQSAAARLPILCEKPLTLTLAEAQMAWDSAARAGVLLATAQNRRFLPAYRRLSEMVRSGHLGQLRQVIGNFSWGQAGYAPDSWRLSPAESPAGGMAGLGIHIVDAMMGLGLRGEAVRVLARGDDSQRPHTVTASIEFEGGPVGVLTTIGGPATPWRFEVHGSEGYAAMDGETRLVHGRAGEPETRLYFGAFDKERAELEAFAETVESGTPWPVTQDQGLAAIALFEAICRGADAPGTAQPVEPHSS
jgi:predicted dehydrogenase